MSVAMKRKPAHRHGCGCETAPKQPACTHIADHREEILKNAGVASRYFHTVAVRRGAARASSPADSATSLFGAIACAACGEDDGGAAAAAGSARGGERPAFSACLQCFFVGCRHRGHSEQHFDESGHVLALDFELQRVYCRSCRSYVHDGELERRLEQGRVKVMSAHRRLGQEPAKAPTDKAAAAAKPPPTVVALREQAYARTSKAQILGLRGMVNMGNTCFMSSILQALVHNPFLRTVFLSDCEWSPAKTQVVHSPRAGETSGGGTAGSPLRLDMLRLFTEMYSGDTAPHAPYYLLHTVWKHSAYLSGYQQQDAHEFLIFILNQLHAQMQIVMPEQPDTKVKTETKPTSTSPMDLSPAAGDSKLSGSIISRVFRGKLRSDVTCCGCGAVSTAHDPFFDLPLDLTRQTEKLANDPAVAAAAAPATGGVTPRTPRETRAPITLSDCLHSFTCTEELDSDGQWVCSRCNKPNKRTKRLSIATLPVILVLQIKRFAKTVVPSAKGNGQTVLSHKLAEHVRFPAASLDLRPYTSAELFSRKQDRETSSRGTGGERAKRVSALLQPAYTLFSVVVHFGSLEQGHYITYVKGYASDKWYKCDDANITRVTRAEVMACEAYLLFYIRESCD